mmetsp:Transcript_22986/g.66597  ORF Transcript_22986/g.66597 Transcript_22986/m.66597 type:complete len:401 (-) Transcript_22986:754-1956(-)
MSPPPEAPRRSPREVPAAPGSVKLGLIADIRYADKDDSLDRSGRRLRFRNSLSVLGSAVDHWNAAGVEAVVQLGSAIDSVHSQAGVGAMAAVLGKLDACRASKRLDVVGNHDLRSFPRAALAKSGLRCFADDGKLYRSEKLNEHWEAIILDAFEQSVVGVSSTDQGFREADKLLRERNPNIGKRVDDLLAGLPEEDHRFVPCNGAVSKTQLRWLDNALRLAAEAGRKVLVFSHIPLYSGAAKHKTLLWNAEDVLQVLYWHSGTVVAVFAGHDHDGGYAVDPLGLHHVTLNAALTAEAVADCCAVLECYDDGWVHFAAHGDACAGHSQLILATSAPSTRTNSSDTDSASVEHLDLWSKVGGALSLAKACFDQVFATCRTSQVVQEDFHESECVRRSMHREF